jgi:hypothetical protein
MYDRLNDVSQALPGGYSGSRLQPNRYMYEDTPRAHFIELQQLQLEPDFFRVLLEQVKGVRLCTDMNDYFHVFAELFPNEPGIKFLISDQFHMRDVNAPATISVCYTVQPDDMHALEAWRILRSSVEGLELHKEIVDELDFQLRKTFRPNSTQPLPVVSLLQNRMGCELDWEDEEIQDYETDTEEDVEDQLDKAKTQMFSVDLSHDDFFTENKMRIMIGHVLPHATSLWSEIWEPLVLRNAANNEGQALPTCAPSSRGEMFLTEARRKSFMFRRWNQDEELLEHKQFFLSLLPTIAEQKHNDCIHETFKSRYQAVCELLKIHDGEVVEVPCTECATWSLVNVQHIRGHDCMPEQFDLGPDYRPTRLGIFEKYLMQKDIQITLRNHAFQTEITHHDIQPNWKNRHSRLSVPCHKTKEYAWLRVGFAITLGELFQKLHHMYTAKEIYYLYLHLDVVAVKKKKNVLQSKKRPYNQSSNN